MRTLDDFARSKLEQLEHKLLRRTLVTTEPGDVSRARRGDQELVSFCSNDYLGLSRDPKLAVRAKAAIDELGVGAGASRHVTGNHPLYAQLEQRLAELKGTEAAVVFGSGYLANIGVVPCLVGAGDLILIDELSHNCLWAGAQLSRARVEPFGHNDLDDAGRRLDALRGEHRRCLLLTDGVFSMDGDLAPLRELVDLCERYDVWLMTDDAHGLGVLGDGRGSAAACGVADHIPLQMGTLSKAVGAYGGYLCASRPVVDLIETRARSLIYTTALPPSVVATAIAGLDVITSDAARVARPLTWARLFCDRLGLPEPVSSIVPLVVGEAGAALRASEQLEQAGFLVTAIRPPTVPDGTARLRFTFSAAHTEADVVALTDAIEALGLELREPR